jgi:hypothetical protein
MPKRTVLLNNFHELFSVVKNLELIGQYLSNILCTLKRSMGVGFPGT